MWWTQAPTTTNNPFAIFLKPLILRALSARKIKGFRKMAKGLLYDIWLIPAVLSVSFKANSSL